MRVHYSSGIERRINRKKETRKREIKAFFRKLGDMLLIVAVAIVLIIAMFYGFEKEGDIAAQQVREWRQVEAGR